MANNIEAFLVSEFKHSYEELNNANTRMRNIIKVGMVKANIDDKSTYNNNKTN